MQKRTKTTITMEIIEEVGELAKQGLNNSMISNSLNIAPQTLSTNKELKESIQEGRLQLAKTISSTILETLESDTSMKQLLVKRLCLFNPHINIKKPRTAKEALTALSNAIELYARGEINESQLRTIEATLNSFIKASKTIDLEERLSKLEKIIK